ncbi:hypothetical protein ACFC1R_23635 [Kitasatospora sp. NPDC056138]|uniref:hypothetical protein n=1 Tax=Kitasatospora sp. NPDC056138 TaxID=3345724 RepID=UPI0035DD692F
MALASSSARGEGPISQVTAQNGAAAAATSSTPPDAELEAYEPDRCSTWSCRSAAPITGEYNPHELPSPSVSFRSFLVSSPVPPPVSGYGPLAGSPVIRRDDQWWLVIGSGAILATDPTFTGELDRFAAAMAAADQAVADLPTDQYDPDGQRRG